jgi:signal recognition particle receptor subunit beta
MPGNNCFDPIVMQIVVLGREVLGSTFQVERKIENQVVAISGLNQARIFDIRPCDR